jgi:hypothetical protein
MEGTLNIVKIRIEGVSYHSTQMLASGETMPLFEVLYTLYENDEPAVRIVCRLWVQDELEAYKQFKENINNGGDYKFSGEQKGKNHVIWI